MVRLFDPTCPTSRMCESCFLNEADTSVGVQLLCEDCAYELAWSQFLAAVQRIKTNRPYAQRTRRTFQHV